MASNEHRYLGGSVRLSDAEEEPTERHSRTYAWKTGCKCAKCTFWRIDQRERERRERERDTDDRRQ